MKRFFRKLRANILGVFNPGNMKIQGECIQCGTCCREMILVDDKKIIQSKEHFQRLKTRYPDIYGILKIKTMNNDGDLVFECIKLKPDNTCSLYNSKERPPMCSAYPTKSIFKRGGNLIKTCGYYVIEETI